MDILKELREEFPGHTFDTKTEILIDNKETGIYYKSIDSKLPKSDKSFLKSLLLSNINDLLRTFLED